MRDRQPAAAVLLGPAQTRQPSRGQVLIPRAPFLERLVFATRPTKSLEGGEFADEVVLEPLPDLGPELLDLYHSCRLTYQALALLGASRMTQPGIGGQERGQERSDPALSTVPAVL